jgi:hypothetical protein
MSISRAAGSFFPALFLLLAALNRKRSMRHPLI